jgi:hypothetical protein
LERDQLLKERAKEERELVLKAIEKHRKDEELERKLLE